MEISKQPNYRGPRLHDVSVGYAGAGTAIRIGVNHDSGRESKLRPTPARVTARVHLPSNGEPAADEWAKAVLVFDVFGSEEGGDLRVGVSSFSVEGIDGQAVGPDLLAKLRPKDLLLVGVMHHAYSSNPDKRTAETVAVTRHEARCFLESGRPTDSQAEVERERMEEHRRIAEVWWNAKRDKQPIGATVAKALGEERSNSKRAKNAANQYVSRLRKSGVLARVGQELGRDLEANEVEPVPVADGE